MMFATISPQSQLTLSQVVNRILGTGTITRTDETVFLQAMVAETPLSAAEMEQVTEVYHRLQMGLLKVVD
jgi:hypothetical protein